MVPGSVEAAGVVDGVAAGVALALGVAAVGAAAVGTMSVGAAAAAAAALRRLRHLRHRAVAAAVGAAPAGAAAVGMAAVGVVVAGNLSTKSWLPQKSALGQFSLPPSKPFFRKSAFTLTCAAIQARHDDMTGPGYGGHFRAVQGFRCWGRIGCESP